jgi:hypothetical protein
MTEAHTDLGGRRRVETVEVEIVGMIDVAEIQDVALNRKSGRWAARRIGRVDDADLSGRSRGSVPDRDLGDHCRHPQLEAGCGAERQRVVGVGE